MLIFLTLKFLHGGKILFYSQNAIEDVRMGNDIVNVVSSYVKLKEKGSSYFGLCPFHNETTPSFSVSVEKQLFHCFGCGASGNVFSFIMLIENYDFVGAVKFLADKINYTLVDNESFSPEMKEKEMLKEVLQDIHKKSARFFYDSLNSDDGKIASEYLDSRELTKSVRTKFGLGYALSARDSLFKYLLESGYDISAIIKSGLVVQGKSGGYFDRFQDRLMIPIFDVNSKIIGFGGRIILNGEPKYLNSPETLLFDKSRTLYSLNNARLAKKREIILVEGYMDVIGIYQGGFKNVVACLGTSFNAEHAKLLKKFVDSVILLFDSDDAGLKAVLRTIPILRANGLKVKVLQVKDAKDPDEFIRKFGAVAFKTELDSSVNHIDFQIKCIKAKYDLKKTEDKVDFILEVSKLLCTLNSAVSIDAYANQIAKITNIDVQSIKTEIEKISDKSLNAIKPNTKKDLFYSQKNILNQKGLIEAKKSIIYIISKEILVYNKIKLFLEPKELLDAVYEKLLTIIYELHEKKQNIYPAEIVNHFETVEEQKLVSDIFNTVLSQTDTKSLEKAVNDQIKLIKKANIDKQAALETEIGDMQARAIEKKSIDKLYITLS